MLRPFHSHRRLSLATVTFLLAGTILLLLVGLSTPIIKPVYLLRIRTSQSRLVNLPATSIATELRFGVWGLCAISVLNNAPLDFGRCYGPQLGYTVPEILVEYAKIDPAIVNAVLTSLLSALIMHLVAAGLSLIATIPALFLSSHKLSITSLILSIIASLISTVVLALDLALVIGTKRELPGLTGGGVEADWGNGVWMVLGGTVAMWMGVILLSVRVCGCCGVRSEGLAWRRRKDGSIEPLARTEKA